MLDIAYIREHPEEVQEAADNKLVDVSVADLLEMDKKRRALQSTVDDLNAQRNELAKNLTGGKPSEEIIAQGKALKEQAARAEGGWREVNNDFLSEMRRLPNIPTSDTPVGKEEAGNVVQREVGVKPTFSFEPKPHWELGAALGIIDSETAGEVAGSRFTYLKGPLAFLQLALTKWVIDTLTNEDTLGEIARNAGLEVSGRAFVPVIPPHMIRPEIMDEMARLEPRDERYHIPSDDVYLIGSAEHTLGPLHRHKTLPASDLPLRYAGISPAYRREAGSHGKDVRGILRLHQFDKVEMEVFSTPEQSMGEHLFLVAIQEYFMQQLKLPYQVVLKCTGDMGTPNARAVDIETWMPAEAEYRETHTADLMTDYQARRLRTRVSSKEGSVFAHMNDATAMAMGRTLIAIMENYQQEDGSITIPDVIRPYLPFSNITGA